jgi:hypothetical protein
MAALDDSWRRGYDLIMKDAHWLGRPEMKRDTPCYAIVVAVLVTGSFACSDTSTSFATLIGCEDSFMLHLTGELPDEFSLAVVGTDGLRFESEISCSLVDCSKKLSWHIPGNPEQITVTVEWADTAVSEVFEPTYAPHNPNGADLPPICTIGGVTMEL